MFILFSATKKRILDRSLSDFPCDKHLRVCCGKRDDEEWKRQNKSKAFKQDAKVYRIFRSLKSFLLLHLLLSMQCNFLKKEKVFISCTFSWERHVCPIEGKQIQFIENLFPANAVWIHFEVFKRSFLILNQKLNGFWYI